MAMKFIQMIAGQLRPKKHRGWVEGNIYVKSSPYVVNINIDILPFNQCE